MFHRTSILLFYETYTATYSFIHDGRGLLASCSSDAPERGAADAVMQFDIVGSRATAWSDIAFDGSKFAVYGNMRFKDNGPEASRILFDNTVVTYNKGEGKIEGEWRYANPQYWFPLFEYAFVALYPAGAAGMADTEYSNSDSRLSFTYNLPVNYADGSDLMVAAHRRMYEDRSSSSGFIQLGFTHIMSRIDFRVKNDKAADFVRVTKIELQGIDRTGNYSITPATLTGTNTTSDYSSSWSDISNRGDLTAEIEVDIPENEVSSLFPDADGLFMIPQPENKGVILAITYEIWDDGIKYEEHTLTATTPTGGWEQGKIYTYSITISEITKEIELSVIVKDWQDWNPDDPSGSITVPAS